MYCSNCGAKVTPDGAKFCAGCGFALSSAPQPEPKKSPESVAPETKRESEPPSDSQLSGVKVSSERSLPLFQPPPTIPNSRPGKETGSQRKWGWGWLLLAGYLFYNFNRVFQGSGCGDYAGGLALLGVTVGVVLYITLRNRVKLIRRITRQGVRSFASGIVAVFVAVIVTAIQVAVLSRYITPPVRKSLDQELSTLASTLRDHGVSLAQTDQTFMRRYIKQPGNSSEFQSNIVLIQESMISLRSHYGVLAQSLRNAEATLESTFKTCPQLKQNYSAAARYCQELGAKVDEQADAYENWLTILLNLNQALNRNDGTADTYIEPLQNATARLESATRAFASAGQQTFGQTMPK